MSEFLTRVNPTRGFRHPEYDILVKMGRPVAAVESGNAAMGCVRCALRKRAQPGAVVYRPTQKESLALGPTWSLSGSTSDSS